MPSLIIRDEQGRAAAIKAIGALDLKRAWAVEWKRHQNKRSLSANSFYWVVVGLIADDTGNSQDDVHEALKAKFCPAKIINLADDGHIIIHTTSKLVTSAFSAYLEKVIAFAESELGLVLPARPDQLRSETA